MPKGDKSQDDGYQFVRDDGEALEKVGKATKKQPEAKANEEQIPEEF